MQKEIIIHKDQSTIFDIVDDTTTPMPIVKQEQSTNLKLSSILDLKTNKELQYNLLLALESNDLDDLEHFFKILSRM